MENREPLFSKDRPSFFRRATWKIKDIYIFLKNIPSNIYMIFQWIPVLWNNWDWDYTYLLIVMKYKLQRMSKYIKKHGHLMNSEDVAFDIDQCVNLIEQIQDGDFVERERQAHKEKWGEIQHDLVDLGDGRPGKLLDIYSPLAREQGREEEEREEQHSIYELNNQREQATYTLLFGLLRDKIQTFWD